MSTTQKPLKIALLGSPNVGKTTLFNKLCGLRQRTGNYPGITVDKKKGTFSHEGKPVEIIDLPGINSLYPHSKDEQLVVDYLLDFDKKDFPDVIISVVSALTLKKNLYLFDQVRDLQVPTVLAVNMVDVAEKKGISIDYEGLSKAFGVTVVPIVANKGVGLEELKSTLWRQEKPADRPPHYVTEEDAETLEHFSHQISSSRPYHSFLRLTQKLEENPQAEKKRESFIQEHGANIKNLRTNESILRYKFLNTFFDRIFSVDQEKAVDLTTRADKILLHPVGGYLIFLLILFTIFQAVFWLASYPMDWIDNGFAWLSSSTSDLMPPGYFTDLVVDGIIPGVGGVLIFIPQIVILFLLFALLEESGYLARIVFLMDRVMQKFGMSGKSVVPMISSLACAVPAIMAARTIENSRERLITILVSPLLTCSARIPVYVVIIAIIIPDDAAVLGFSMQGIVLMGMYLLGVLTSFAAAYVFKKLLQPTYKSFLVMEMPDYLRPNINNVLIRVWTNVKSFVWDAGRIIVAVSIILFVLATNGGERFQNSEEYIENRYPEQPAEFREQLLSSYQMKTSYLGTIGQGIEPVIKPLGYDWKIGIAVISSLAAREVFVGTMSVIYSVNSEDEMTIRDRLVNEKDPVTGLHVFSLATSISLLLFYAFALQCMSTIAVTYKETKSIKWTSIQFGYMTALAYLSAMIAYQLLK